MSWIIVRKKGDVLQTYNDADIYGHGHFGGEKITDLPEQYAKKGYAESHLYNMEKEDGWDYSVEHYE